jgi:hypothetical protein
VDGVELVDPLGVEVLQRLGGPSVELSPAADEQGPVGRLLGQHVLEAVFALRDHGQLAHEVGALGDAEVLHELGAVHGDPLQHALSEASSDHRGRLERRAGLAEPVDAGHDQRLQAVRDLDAAEVGVHAPAPFVPDEQAPLDEGPDQLLDPERGPGRSLQDVTQAGWQLLQVEQVPDELGARVLGERLEHDLGVDVRQIPGRALAERPRRRVAVGAKRVAEEDGALLGQGHQLEQQIHRARIGPVEVVELHGERGDRCLPGDELGNGVERETLQLLRRAID